MLSSDDGLFSLGIYEFLDTGERFKGRPDSFHLGAGDSIEWNLPGDIVTPREDIEFAYKDGRRIRKVG